MTDCLIMVERNVSKPDIIHRLIQKTLTRYFKNVGAKHLPVSGKFLEPPLESLANDVMGGPLSLTSIVLATALMHNQISFSILDDDDLLGTYRDSFARLIGGVKVVALSTTFVIDKKSLAQLVAGIRAVSPDVPIILGGQGVPALSLNPISATDNAIFEGVNAVVYGDGEEVFPALVKDYRDGKSHLRNLPGVLYRREGKWEGSQEPIEADVNEVLIPDFSVLDHCEANDNRLGRSIYPATTSLEEGRGCSFKCRFCSYFVYSQFRRKSPERIVAELQAVKKLGYDKVAFVGAEFLNPVKSSAKIFDAMSEAALGIQSWMYARLDLLTRFPWLLDKIIAAGVTNLDFGMESGDETILKKMNKYYDVEGMIRGAKLARKNNLVLSANLVVGYPGETGQSIKNTIRVLLESDFNYLDVHALNVVPDTPLWNLRDEYNLKVNDTGFWAHDTMSVVDIPQAIKQMIAEVHAGSSSLFSNVKRNIVPGFLRPGKEKTDQKKLDSITKTLTDIMVNEWLDFPSPGRRVELWNYIERDCTQMPVFAQQAFQSGHSHSTQSTLPVSS